jgi:kynurenine formamidase
LTRRGFFRRAGAASVAIAATASGPSAVLAQAAPAFKQVVDLTHVFSPEFPTFFGKPGIEFKTLFDFKKDGFNLKEWTVLEHSGTHLDAPIHFSENGIGPDQIPVDTLVVPLAVIDVSAKAAANPDYQLTPEDITAWESANGKLPDGSAVAMNSGWDQHVASPKFIGKDAQGVLHFPGFHPDATAFLLNQRKVVGLLVDTLSLDYGASKDFKTHYAWLPSGRWGLENVANLGRVPAKGATLVVGAPKIKGATGGPTRVYALV